ncbi:hypothetical protein KQH41_00010 [bacterium]|nr:hypothetical protein [bacterium]
MRVSARFWGVVVVTLFGVVGCCLTAAAGTVDRVSFISHVENEDGYTDKLLVDQFKVTGIAPWDLGTVSMTTPGGVYDNTYSSPEWAVNYNQNNGTVLGPLLWPYNYPIPDGRYEYAFHDNEGSPLLGSPLTVDYVSRQLVPPDASSMTTAALAGTELYIGMTAPAFAWQPAEDDVSLHYRVVVVPYNENENYVVWKSALFPYAASMNTSIPAGILTTNNAYRWAVEVYDADDLTLAGNGARSEMISFFTGAGGQPLAVSDVIALSRVRSSAYETLFGAIITGAAPWDVSIDISGSGGYSAQMDGDDFYGDGYWQSYQSQSSDTNLDGQIYTFTVNDNREDPPATVIDTRTLTPNWTITPHDDDSMFQVGEAGTVYTETPTFSWGGQEGIDYYRLQIFSYAVDWSWSSAAQSVWTGEWTTGLSATVPENVLAKDSAYMWRVETRDADGNRGRGSFIPFFIADEQLPLSVSGRVTISSGSYSEGSFIRIEATDSPVFPGGTSYSFVHITPTMLPADYTLYNIPHTDNVYIHAIWDQDGSDSFTVGDHIGDIGINTTGSTDPVVGQDIDLSEIVPAAISFFGEIACLGWQSGYGDILISVLNHGDEDEVLAAQTIAAPGPFSIADTSQIPVDGRVSVMVVWDTDGSGGLTPTDQVVVEDGVQVIRDTDVGVITIEIQSGIFGTAYLEDGVTPAAGKMLSVNNEDHTYSNHLFTDENGMYSMAPLPDGNYRVSLTPYYDSNWNYQPNQYLVLYYDGRYHYDDADLVAVDSGNLGQGLPYVTENINFVMQQGVYITGQVSDSGGNPISDVPIEALAENEKPMGNTVLTDETGRYRLLVPPNGNYYAYANPQGGWQGPLPYVNQYWGDVKPWEDPPNIVVGTTEVPNIDFTLADATIISGLVSKDADGSAIADIWVDVFDYSSGDFVQGASTGTDGSYSIFVPPGSYKVSVCPTCSWDNPQPYLSEYYNDTDFESAAEVNTATGNQNEINFSLADATIISGLVSKDADGGALADIWVEVFDFSSADFIEGSYTRTDGTYEIFVPPGSYKVSVCPSCSWDNPQPYLAEYYSDTDFDGANEVNTATENQGGINFSLADATIISGLVTRDSDGTPIADIGVEVFDYSTGTYVETAYSRTDGTYSVFVPSGSYKVSVCPTCSWDNPQPYLREYYSDCDYDNAEEVSTQLGNQGEINFSLADGAVISGIVTRRDGVTPLSNIWVEAWHTSSEEYAAGSSTTSDGSYMIAVPAGTYRVEACASCNYSPFINQNYDGQYHGSYTPVTTSLAVGAEGIDFDLSSIVMGDVNGDESVDLTDAVLGLKVITGSTISEPVFGSGSVNGDNRIGMPEVLYILNAEAD